MADPFQVSTPFLAPRYGPSQWVTGVPEPHAHCIQLSAPTGVESANLSLRGNPALQYSDLILAGWGGTRTNNNVLPTGLTRPLGHTGWEGGACPLRSCWGRRAGAGMSGMLYLPLQTPASLAPELPAALTQPSLRPSSTGVGGGRGVSHVWDQRGLTLPTCPSS